MPRPKSFDEDAVLDQAVELFRERGYEGTSMADLEAHLGLGRQSLYNSFGDKHALFLKALDRYKQEFGNSIAAKLAAPDAGLEAIRRHFHSAVQSLTSPQGRHGCLLTKTISELGTEDPAALLRCNHGRDSLERSFRQALIRAKERGEVSADLDVDATATLLGIQNYGLNVMATTGATADQLHAAVEALLSGLK
jgi:TetR/AcrR family transcriptional regulator, transcriptional repressor for nem operon